jgi:hypothetical protein
MIGFIRTSVTSSLNHTYYSAIPDLHTFQFTVAHALGFSVFSSRLLATDLNTEISTSNHKEVFLLFLVQSPWVLGTQLKTLLDSSSLLLACSLLPLTPPAYDCLQTTFVVPYKPSARTYRKHVMWSLSTVVWRQRLRGSVFTKPLPRNGLHNSVVLLLRACNTGCLSSRCLAMRWHIAVWWTQLEVGIYIYIDINGIWA